MAEFIRASGEDRPEMTVEVWLDGKQQKEVEDHAAKTSSRSTTSSCSKATPSTAGKHKVEFRKKGTGPLYFNGYLTNFTLEDFITKAGLEIKVNRKYYKLIEGRQDDQGRRLARPGRRPEGRKVRPPGAAEPGHAQERRPGGNRAGDRQQERLRVPDVRGHEGRPASSRSICEAATTATHWAPTWSCATTASCSSSATLARGKHSVSYRMRAEIPGKFSALPTRAAAMYAPELKANSDEIKLKIEDAVSPPAKK